MKQSYLIIAATLMTMFMLSAESTRAEGSFLPPLSGTYTIGGVTPDYVTISEAFAELASMGVEGPTIFEIRDGSYIEQVSIGNIAGVSAVNTVTFRSESLDSSMVVMSFNSPSNSNYVLLLNNTDFLTFEHLTFESVSSNYGRVITLVDTVENLTFQNCAFKAIDNNDYLIYGNDIENFNTTIQNCLFVGNGYAIHLDGTTISGNYVTGLKVHNNQFLNQNTRAIYTRYQRNLQFTDNTTFSNSTSGTVKLHFDDSYDSLNISNNILDWKNGGAGVLIQAYRTTSGIGSARISGNEISVNSSYGIQVDGNASANGTMIFTENIIHVFNGNYGIQYYYDGTSTNRSLFANNYIFIGGSLTKYAFYGSSHWYTDIYYNSFNVKSTGGTSFGYWESCGRFSDMVNNIYNIDGNGQSLYITNCYGDVFNRINYNNYYSNNGLIHYRGGNYSSIEAYQDVWPIDSHSVSIKPYFLSDTSYQIAQNALNGIGVYLEDVAMDIEGDVRDLVEPDIGADEFIPPSADAGIIFVGPPTAPFTIGSQPITVAIQNFGTDALTVVDISWETNGVPQPTVQWTGTLLSGDSTLFQIGSTLFEIETGYAIKAWTTGPNNTLDPYAINDTTIVTNLYAGLDGLYTLGGTTPDFIDFTSLKNQLNYGGVLDAVQIDVRDGTYAEQFVFTPFPGSDSSRQVLIQGESGDSSLAMLTFNSPSNSNYVMTLSGTDNIAFKHLTFKSLNSNYGRVVTLSGTLQNISFENCLFESVNQYDYHLYGNNIVNDSFIIRNCRFENNGYGINLRGTTNGNNYNPGMVVENNRFNNQRYNALYSRYQLGPKFNDNLIVSNFNSGSVKVQFDDSYNGIEILNNTLDWPNGSSGFYFEGYRTGSGIGESVIRGNKIEISTGYGFYLNGTSNATSTLHFTENIIDVKNGTYGVQYYFDGHTSNRALFANNYIHVGGSNTNYGFYGSSFFYTNIYNNSINVTNTSGTSYGYWESCGRYTELVNNIFYVKGSGYSIYVNNCYNEVFNRSDYNSFYSPGGSMFYRTTNHASLEAFQTATAFDSNSIYAIPFFINDSSYQTAQVELKNAGDQLAEISFDIEGDVRDTMPDIGADEFDLPAVDAGIQAVILPDLPFPSGVHVVKGVLKNFGENEITSADIAWKVNGLNQTTINWTGSLASGDTVLVELGDVNFEIAHGYRIDIKSVIPNNVADILPVNDSIFKQNIHAGLLGTYTLGGVTPDFENFSLLQNQLNYGGVLGPVQIDVRDGVYNEQFSLNQFPGTSLGSVVTIQSESGDRSLVSLAYDSPNTAQWTIRLNGTDYITFQNMTIQSLDQNYARVITLIGNLRNLTFQNCAFTSVGLYDYFMYGNDIVNPNTTIQNCSFVGNGYGLYLDGTTNGGSYVTGGLIENNVFQNMTYWGIYTRYNKDCKVNNNEYFSNSTGSTHKFRIDDCYDGVEFRNNKITIPNGSNGVIIENRRTGGGTGDVVVDSNIIHVNSGAGFTIQGNGNANGKVVFTNNRVNALSGGFGIQYYYVSNVANRSLIANNFFHVGGTGTKYGFYGSSHYYTNIYHNTFNITSPSGVGYAYWESCGRETDLINNIFHVEGNGRGMYVTNCYANVFTRSDYNNFKSTTGDLMYYKVVSYSDLAAYQLATNLDSNSVSIDPLFINDTTDLHVTNVIHDKLGTHIPEVLFDIDGDTRDAVRPDIGADEFSTAANDLSILRLDAPKMQFPAGNNQVTISVLNNGLDTLRSFTVQWDINGDPQPSFDWTGEVLSGSAVDSLAIGSYQFEIDSNYTLTFYTENPNGQLDGYLLDDTLTIRNHYAALGGTYTIGGISPDFESFTRAMTALENGGVIDSVIFNVRDGVYNERLVIPAIAGASEIRTITFQSESADPNLAQLQFVTANTDSTNVIVMDGADYFIFKNLTINSTGSVYARVVHFKNGAHYNSFVGNRIVSNIINSTSTNHHLVYVTANQQNHGNQFIGNTLIGGSNGIYYLSSSSFSDDVRIIDNSFEKQYQRAIYSSYLRNLLIRGNTISNSGSYNNYVGIEPYYSGQDFIIDGNTLTLENGVYGIFITSYNDEGTLKSAIVSNNMIICNGTSSVSGIRITASDYAKILHNTIRINSTSTNSRAINFATGIEHYVYNNICANFGPGQTIYATSTSYLTDSDFNDLFTNGANIGTYGSARSTFENWQMTTGFDANSISLDPLFENDSSYIVLEIELNNTGTPVDEVTFDIDGDPRDLVKPDIGADEYTPVIPDDIGVVEIISPNQNVPFSGVDEPVIVVLRNNGSNNINTATIHSVIDEVNQFPYSWTGNLEPGARDTIMIGTTNLSFNVQHDIISYSSVPNGVADNTPSNDTTEANELYAGLIGVYTIGGVLPNFNTINEAVNILNKGGVLGTVELRLRNGNYNEQILLEEVDGVSATNTVTFTAESGDPSLVVIERSGTSSMPFTIRLSNTDYMIFENMTLQSNHGSYGSVIYLQNGSSNIVFNDNFIQANSETNDDLVYSPSSSREDYIEFHSNTFIKGGRGIDMRGGSSNTQKGIRIENNAFIDQNYEGIYLDKHESPIVSNNTFAFLQRNPNSVSIHLYDCDGQTQVDRNVINRQNGAGIQMQYCNSLNSLSTGQVINNVISIGGSGNVNGLYLNSCSLLKVLHNSVHMYNTNASSKAFRDGANTNNSVLNNIFANSGGGYAFYKSSSTINESDYNNLYSTGSNLGYWVNANITDLPAWKLASSEDDNSVSINPLFFSNENLHVLQVGLDGNALIIPEVDIDFEGDARSLTAPDIGADEFDFITDDIGVIEIADLNNGCELASNEQIIVVIQNYGGVAQSGFEIEVSLNNGPPIIENIGSVMVPPGDTVHYMMSTSIDLSAYQIHNIDVSTILSGDLNMDNDAFSTQVQNYQTPAVPTNLLPGDGQMDVSKPMNFSWLPSEGATLYDLFIWADTLPQPAAPYFANLSQISAVINTSAFVFGVSYSWQIVAKNPYCVTPSQIQTFTLRELPDLISSNIQVPVAPFSSQTISVSWNVDNIGIGATLDETWYDQVYLSQDQIFSTNVDIYLGAIANLSALAPTESYAHSLDVTLPQGISGTWYLFIRPNGYGNIPESNLNNNPNFEPINISLTPPPDLQVTSVIPPNNAFSGTNITVSYTVTNEGSGDTEESSWRDYFYISDQLQFNLNDAIYLEQTTHNGQLLGGASYTSSKVLELPDEIFGDYFIHVFTDRQSQVYEFAFEDNNVGSSDTMHIFFTPPPDMELTSIIIPDTLSPSQTINAVYTVSNVGATAAVGNWRDRIYISAVDTFDASAISLRTINKSGVLNAGFNYLNAGQITIPANYSGDYYLYFRTDYQNSIFEFNSEANNILRSDTIAIVAPDLQVQSLTIPPSGSSGKTLAVQWNTKNVSRGKIFNKPIIDGIYISSLPSFDGSAQLIGELAYSVTLNQEGITSRQKNVLLPNGISGTYYIHVLTDQTDKVFEDQFENNNSNSTVINVLLSPSPDLQVTSFGTLPDTAFTVVSNVPVSFTVGNQGAASATGNAWKEMLYLSTDSIWNDTSPNNFLLKEHERFQPVINGSNYTLNYNIAFPMVEQLVPGRDSFMFYLYAVTDSEDKIYEHGALNDNNVLRSASIYLICPTETDLRVSNLSTIPSDTLETNQEVTLSWTVDNIGSSTAIWGYDIWYDGVYLSNDSIWDPDDLLIEDFTQEGPLDSLAYYTDMKTITIPEVPAGIYCLMMRVDNQEYLDEESKENNDAIFPVAGPSGNIYITQKPPANLVAKTFTAPVDGISGQPIDVIIKVKNEGVGEVDENWVDKIYLSTDFTISNSDNILYTKVKNPPLLPGEEYSDTIQVFMPINKEGNFILLFKTDANNRIFEMGNEGDNKLFTFITLDRDDPSDLIVENAVVPPSVFVNQKIDINYGVKNIGQFPASGFQRDIIYLSQDSVFDVTDVQLGLSELTSQLAPGGAENRTIEMVCTPGVPLGDYHVIIQTDALNNIYEVSDENNVFISPSKINIQVEELPLDVLTQKGLIHRGNVFFRIEVPDTLHNETMQVTLISDQPLASNELYLSFDQMPTRSTHDYSHTIPFGPHQKVVVPELDSGTYYLRIYGESGESNPQGISVIAQIIEFSIIEVDKNVAGNTGTMTARIEGAKFTETMEVRLEDDVLGTHIATKLFFINSTEVFASFNLAGAELGLYDVVIEKPGGGTTSLEDGFTIIEGPVVSIDAFGPDESGFTCNIKNLGTENLLSSNIIAPSAVRVGRLVPITIQFGNNGSMDIPCPQRFILSVRGAPLGFSPEEIPEMKQELLLVFEEPGGPPGILRPGATGSITVYTFSSHPLRFYIQE